VQRCAWCELEAQVRGVVEPSEIGGIGDVIGDGGSWSRKGFGYDVAIACGQAVMQTGFVWPQAWTWFSMKHMVLLSFVSVVLRLILSIPIMEVSGRGGIVVAVGIGRACGGESRRWDINLYHECVVKTTGNLQIHRW
jgi:hypothetical protein